MTGLATDANTADPKRATHIAQRRLESDVSMLRSDRLRLERKSNELDAEIRTMKRGIDDRQREVEERQAERARLVQRIQNIDAEILHLKRTVHTP